MSKQVQNEAYDFSLFEPKVRPEKQRDNVVKLPAPKRRKKRKSAALEGYKRAFGILMLSVFAIGLVGYMVYCKAQLTELGAQNTELRTELTKAEGEGGYLRSQLEERMAASNIEQLARNLGMQRTKPYQIQYIRLSNGDIVQVSE